MHTPRLPLVLLLTIVVVSGCRSREPAAQMLPDTPDAPYSRAELSRNGAAGQPDPEDGMLPAEVRRLRDRIEEQNKLFAGAGDPPPLRTNPSDEPGLMRASPPAPRITPPPPTGADPVWSPQPRSKPSPTPLKPQPQQEPRPVPPAKPPAVPLPEPTPPLNKDEPGMASPPPRVPSVSPATKPAETHLGSAHTPTPPPTITERDALEREFDKRVKERPSDPVAHLNQQLLRLLLDRPVPMLSTMTSLPADDRDAIAGLIDALVNYRNGLALDPTALPSKKLEALLKLADQLREQTELSIPTMTLCRKVDGYGIYDSMPLSFKAGQEHETIIYCEVENFSSRFSEATKLWETKLTMEAVLYNSAGDELLKGKDNVPTDQCRKRRRDFFVVKRLKLPATLAASRYILKVTIVDEQARRVAEQSLNIMMMAQ